MTDEERWETAYPGTPIPGSAEPEDDRCGAQLRQRTLRDLHIIRFCRKGKGERTEHVGTGHCYMHLGNSPNHVRQAARIVAYQETVALAERLGEPRQIGDYGLELGRLAAKVVAWEEIATEKLTELQDHDFTSFDKAGVERARAIIEIFERAMDRSRDTLISLEKLGLTKRRLELEEWQARLIADTVKAVFLHSSLQLTDEQVDVAMGILAEAMFKIAPQLRPAEFALLDPSYDDAEIIDE